MNIKLLPNHYLLKRWTREAKSGTIQDTKGRDIIEDPKSGTTSYINLLGFFVQQQEKENQVGGETQATTENANNASNAFRSYTDLLMVL